MNKPAENNNPVSYKPPKHLRAEFNRMVSDSGLSRNAYITEAIFGGTRHRPAEQKFLGRILGMCGLISDQLREPSFSSNEQVISLLEQSRDELIKIRSLLMQALGRRS